jgi:hypothetical protein
MRHKRKSNKRKRSVKQRLLILCEGETERNYFLAMREDTDFKQQMAATNIDIVTAKNSTPEQIVKEAVKKNNEAKKDNNPYQKTWLVFDHDNHAHRCAAFDEGINEHDFGVSFSAICFEMWYLLHFVKSAKAFVTADELIKVLKKHYPYYKKAKRNDFSFLKEHLEKAIENAKWLRKNTDKNNKHTTDCNPWVDVDLLIDYLKSL